MSNTIIEVRGLTKQYDGLTAVNNVSFDVHARRIHALIGPNGAGKTTTLSMINGTLEPTFGSIKLFGQDITRLPAYKVAQMGIARTYQNIKIFGSLTVRENLMVGAMLNYNRGGVLRLFTHFKEANRMEREMYEMAEQVAADIGLAQFLNAEASSLPYGQQKVLELGRSLMSKPKIILLDEPAAGLNPSERVVFVSLLQKVYERGIDLFLIEHNMDVVMNISHEITVLNFGQKIASGSPAEIQKNPEVIKAYLGDRYVAIQ